MRGLSYVRAWDDLGSPAAATPQKAQ